MIQERLQILNELQQAQLSQNICKNDHSKAQDKIIYLMENNKTLQENIKQMVCNKEELIAQRDSMLENLENLNKTLSELEKRIVQADEAKRICASEVEILRQELGISKKKTADYKALCNENAMQLDLLNRQIKGYEECVADLKMKVENLESVNLLHEEQLASAMKEIVEKNQNLSTVIRNHEALEKQLQTKELLKTEKIEFLESKLKDLETVIAEKSKALTLVENEHETKMKVILTKLEQFRADKDTKEKELEEQYFNKVQSLDRAMAELNIKQQEMSQENNAFLETEREKLQNTHQELLNSELALHKAQLTQEYETKMKVMLEINQQAQEEFTKNQNLVYIEKLAALETDKLAFENNLNLIFEEKCVQIEAEKLTFKKEQEEKLKEAIVSLEREKTEEEAQQQLNFVERLKVIEREKQDFIAQQERIFEEKLEQFRADKDTKKKELEEQYFNKVQSLDRAMAELNTKQQEMSQKNRVFLETEREKLQNTHRELLNSELALHKAQLTQGYEDKKSLLETEKLQFVEELKLKYQEKENLLQRSNEAFLDSQKTLNDKLVARLTEEKMQFESAVEQRFTKQLQVLEEDKTAFLKSQETEFTSKISELEKEISSLKQTIADLEKEKLISEEKRKSDRAKALVELKKLEQENKAKADKLNCLDEKYKLLIQDNEKLLINVQSKDSDLKSLRLEFTQYKQMKEEQMVDLVDASEKNNDCLNNIISEMSDKIQNMEEEITQLLMSQTENWKEKFEDLEKKLAPFKETLDAFELERKLLQDRDKYTSEQIEKLTKEAIKNMGHQNHRQRVKYVDKLKQENITLQMKLRDTQEELHRQNVLVKKYKESLEKMEGSKDHCFKTPLKPRIPLKEGNR